MTLIAKNHITHDTFGNTHIDLSRLALSLKKIAQVIKEMIPAWIETGKTSNKHMITLKLSPMHSRIHKYALDAGFLPHHADSTETVMVLCLHSHNVKQCNYPAYKTVSIGVTGVVFNQTLDKFLAIKEKFGPYKDWKAPTGSVDTGEEPVNAVVRELLEETGVHVKAEDAVFVGEGWTPNFRGSAPDINQVFAFQIDETRDTLIAQEDEIEHVKWLSVTDFANLPVTLNHDKPFVIKTVVEAAHRSLINQTGWHVNKSAWASGKDIRFYMGAVQNSDFKAR
jgi:ADP-ribose pyrophosphatase YjhB (NUDIX family)